MSTRYIPTKDTFRQKNLKWSNQLVHLHDTFCYCDSPLQHTIAKILLDEPTIKFNTQETDLLKKCLTTPEDPVTDGADDGGFAPGDLERLFSNDDGEDIEG